MQAASVQAVAAFYDLGWHTVKSIDKMRLRARVAEPDWSTIRYLAMDEFALHKGHRYVQAASVQAVAAFYELGWHTVKSIDKMRLRARVAEPDWSTIRYLAMDEFALHKGHRYAGRLVMSQLVGLIHPYPIDHLATVLGHDVVQVKDDFRLWALFLDLQLIGRGHVDCREVIDRVRVDQANQLRHDKPARKVLKSSRWLLLRNRHNLKPEQAVHLKELLAGLRLLTNPTFL